MSLSRPSFAPTWQPEMQDAIRSGRISIQGGPLGADVGVFSVAVQDDGGTEHQVTYSYDDGGVWVAVGGWVIDIPQGKHPVVRAGLAREIARRRRKERGA